MAPVQPASWLREARAWLSNRSAWPERLVGCTFLLSAAGLIFLTANWLTLGQALLVWIGYATALGICSWFGWVKLLGPVLFYDMIRTARRNRYFILRMLYAGFLFFILAYMVLIAYLVEREFKAREYAVLAESFFMVFMLVQLTLVVLLTPAYVAGSISEEKDRRTIEFMLATDLRNREIVLSKLLSRLGNMALLLLTGLPILSILQFIGGVDPELMLAGFVAIALSMLGIGSVSILFSTLFKKPRDAISLTYLLMIAYAALALFALGMRQSGHPLMSTPIWFGADPPTLSSAAYVFNAGNPIAAIWDLSNAIGGRVGGNLAGALPGILERYAWFHGTLAVVCVTWSILRLRSIALKQTVAGETVRLRWWQRMRPVVGDHPMLWKELFIEGRPKLNWLIWIAGAVIILLTLGTGLWILGYFLYDYFFDPFRNHLDRLPESMNIWFRITGTFVACLMLLMAGVRASTSITSERERSTFDALITSPMSAEGMLFAKLVGNLTGMRLGWFWFGTMLALALFTGGIHPVAVPIILAACFVYAVFVTMLGLAFSVFCRSSLQSAVFTVLSTLVLGGAHWLITSCFCAPLFGAFLGILMQQFRFDDALIRILNEIAFYFIKFQAGVTPPFVFAWCSFSWDDFNREIVGVRDRTFWEFIGFSVLGLLLWGAASVILWFAILIPKFRRITRRVELEE